MRTVSEFHANSPAMEPSKTGIKTTFSPPSIVQRSPWHSPVPYLFGGLAAMLGLIAFALLILACSYWKLSGHLRENGGDVEPRDDTGEASTGEKADAGSVVRVFEEKIVVIMAGDLKPTFLATPMSSKCSGLDKCENKTEKGSGEEELSRDKGNKEEVVIEVGDQDTQ